jgi:hypothetical protein
VVVAVLLRGIGIPTLGVCPYIAEVLPRRTSASKTFFAKRVTKRPVFSLLRLSVLRQKRMSVLMETTMPKLAVVMRISEAACVVVLVPLWGSWQG